MHLAPYLMELTWCFRKHHHAHEVAKPFARDQTQIKGNAMFVRQGRIVGRLRRYVVESKALKVRIHRIQRLADCIHCHAQ